MSKLQIGDKAPEINAVDQNGNNISVGQYYYILRSDIENIEMSGEIMLVR